MVERIQIEESIKNIKILTKLDNAEPLVIDVLKKVHNVMASFLDEASATDNNGEHTEIIKLLRERQEEFFNSLRKF
jgi:hypothetical protein